MTQRTTEWLDNDKINHDYHSRQFRSPNQSTIAFCSWLETLDLIGSTSHIKVIDMCCGSGAATYYMARKYPRAAFLGVDINNDLIAHGNSILRKNSVYNCVLERGDLYNLGPQYRESKYDGITSLQTLSWLPDFSGALSAITNLNPGWIAISSLFYDGPISCTIEVAEYNESLELRRKCFYNVYSLSIVCDFLRKNGYQTVSIKPFEIDIDLPRPTTPQMATYTERLEDRRRLQISGPLLMPWYFIAARRV